MLPGVDDGADSDQTAWAMLDEAYQHGTRHICFTPHFHPEWKLVKKKPQDWLADAALFRERALKRYPDLAISFGNEIRYYVDCVEHLREGSCLTLNGSRYVLVDFNGSLTFYALQQAAMSLLDAGYLPIIAHVERYPALLPQKKELVSLVESGVLFQIDADAFTRGNFKTRSFVRYLLRHGLLHVVASDAHDCADRPPRLDQCAEVLTKWTSPETCRALFWDNPQRILQNKLL